MRRTIRDVQLAAMLKRGTARFEPSGPLPPTVGTVLNLEGRQYRVTMVEDGVFVLEE